jgi:tripartite-type tricarboxylate transporter receptor subunit TctC
VMSPKRTPELPDVPTLTEAGLPGVEMTTWYGLFVTAGTPKPVVDKLYAETAKILQMPDVQKRLTGLGGEPGNVSQAEFAAMVKSDYDRFGKLIKDANVKLEQ